MMDRSCNEGKPEGDKAVSLEKENARLQRLVAELLMKNQTLRDMLSRLEANTKPPELFAVDCFAEK
jgi:hypothetical protein